MMLVVFVKKTLKSHIKEIAAEHVGTGIMGKMVCFILNSDHIIQNTKMNIQPWRKYNMILFPQVQ